MSALQDRRRTRIGDYLRLEGAVSDGRQAAALTGYALLLAALVLTLVTFSGWVVVIVAALATGLISLDRRVGPLPAAMLVMLALPVGRGAEVGLADIAGYPVRPHDAIALTGVALAMPRVLAAFRDWRRVVNAATVPFLVLLGIGLLAVLLGFLGDQVLRDVVRDARWWAFYAIGLLALLAAVRPDQVIRALTWGMTLYALVVLIGLLMPGFDGGLKLGAYLYDERMRMHYGQAIFLLPAATFATTRALRRPIPWLAIVGLLAAATAVTLTRALMAAFAGVILLTVAWTLVSMVRGSPFPRSIAGVLRTTGVLALAVGVMLGAGLGAGVAAYSAGTQIWFAADEGDGDGTGSGPTADRPAVNAADRIVGREGTDLEAQAGGRLASYARAFLQTAAAPVLGHGAGELTYVDWVRGEFAGHTRNAQPGVDNAYLTVGLKAGALGIAALAALLLWPLRRFLATPRARYWSWYLPAWLGILGLSLIQSFAVSGYAPFALSLLVALPFLNRPRFERPETG